MKYWKTLVQILFLFSVIFFMSGCTFFAASGGGPLKRSELGDWVGIREEALPEHEALSSIVKDLEYCSSSPLSGMYFFKEGPWASAQRGPAWLNYGDPREIPFFPARGLTVKGKFNPWLRLIPSSRHGDWLYYGPKSGSRQFYASENEWGGGMLIGDFLLAGDQANAYDIATRERVAARKTNIALSLIGYTRIRRVTPIGRDGEPSLHAIVDPEVGLDEVKYELKDGTSILMGLFGWGRVNHCRYLQLLWIPIPTGTVKSQSAGAASTKLISE